MTEFETQQEIVRRNILKSFGVDDASLEKAKSNDELEKTHKEGDTTTYQGRTYVWGQTRSGKMGWRLADKSKGGTANSTQTTVASKTHNSTVKQSNAQSTQTTEYKGKSTLSDKDKDYISNAGLAYINDYLNKNRSDNLYDAVTYATKEYERIKTSDISRLRWDGVKTEADREALLKRKKDAIVTAEERLKLHLKRKKELTAKKNELLKNSDYKFTDSEIDTYLDLFAPYDPAATIQNTWKYAMGRIGSTSATISIGENGKPKFFDKYNTPSWRPIAKIEYSVRGWDGKSVDIVRYAQSWDDILDALSDEETHTVYVYKHPKK